MKNLEKIEELAIRIEALASQVEDLNLRVTAAEQQLSKLPSSTPMHTPGLDYLGGQST